MIAATNGTGRTLPHSLQTEQHLLSCCMLEDTGADTITRAKDAGLSQASFYDPKHGIVFDCLRSLRDTGKPTQVWHVQEALEAAGTLERIGGVPFLTQVSGLIPTGTQASDFIEKIRTYSLRREIIRSATWAAEQAYELKSDNAGDLAAEIAQRAHTVAAGGTSLSIMARLESCRYNPKRRLPDVAPVFSLGKVPVCTRGNLSTITAQSKTGKSSFLSGMMAATFLDPDHGGDTFTVRGLNVSGHALVCFDTEQPAKKHEQLMDIAMRRAGATALPHWLHSYARKGASVVELREELEAVLKSTRKAHGGIFAVMLDGVADFVNDVNCPKECNPFVTWLEKLAVEYDTTIPCVLHLNPVKKGDSIAKARGHLGSQMQRKAETDIRLKKDEDDITTIFTDPQGTRGQPVFEKDGPRFKWDRDADMHLSTSGTKQNERDREKAARLREIAGEVWGDDRGLRYSEIIPRIMAKCRIKDSGAEEKFSDMSKLGVITKQIHLWHIAA